MSRHHCIFLCTEAWLPPVSRQLSSEPLLLWSSVGAHPLLSGSQPDSPSWCLLKPACQPGPDHSVTQLAGMDWDLENRSAFVILSQGMLLLCWSSARALRTTEYPYTVALSSVSAKSRGWLYVNNFCLDQDCSGSFLSFYPFSSPFDKILGVRR